MFKRNTQYRQKIGSCLKFDRAFVSEHRFNRLCENCSRQNANINYGFYVFNRRVSSKKELELITVR